MKSVSPYIGEKITLFVPCGTKEVFLFSSNMVERGHLD